MPLCHDHGSASTSGSPTLSRLADSLAAQPGDEVALTFTEIEAILKWPLPATAYLRTWWTRVSASQVQARMWRQAGWEVAGLARQDRAWLVTFRRRPADTAS